MKKRLFLLIIIITALSISGETWRKATSASYGALNKVFFLNENTGWMVGTKATILKTTNGGETWLSPLNEPLIYTKSIYSVSFVDENNGYFGGAKNLFLKTTDGGNTIDSVYFPIDDKATIRAIHFLDVNTGWVLSTQSKKGKVYYTADGGINWTIQITEDNNDLESMHFYSSTKAICVGGGKNSLAIYSTTDGQSWTKSAMPSFPISYSKLDLHAVFMQSETKAFIVGYGSSSVGLQPSILLKSNDGGATWIYAEQNESNRVHTNLYGITFKDESNGLAVGGSAVSGGVLYKTTDAGTTWERINFPFGFSPKSIYSIGNKVWIAGGSGGSSYSTDFGSTWTLSTELPTSTLFALQFVTNQVAYAGGYGGLVMKTTNGGSTWKANYVPNNNLSPAIESICFINENIGFLARKNRLISKTTDGGNSWTTILQDTSWNKTTLYGIHFLNENFGMAVGKFGTGSSALYKTTDGGNSWDKQLRTFDEQLSSVYLFDESNGVVVGRKKVVSYTTNGGNAWTNSTLNGLPDPSDRPDFNDVKFFDNNFGLIGGDALLKSNDGGKVWDYVTIPDSTKEIKACGIVDEQTWYITGSRFVFKTTDAGTTWSDVSYNSVIAENPNLSAIEFDGNGYPWISGGTSQIFTLAPVTDVEKNKNTIINNFQLKQNYPNPFNPTTTIKYNIPSVVRNAVSQKSNTKRFSESLYNVTLKVYDILGNEITTLVNEAKQPGSYNVTFNAANLASGVYYYTLNYNKNIIARKMLLIK